MTQTSRATARPVPASRLSRLTRLGGMTSGVLGGMAVEGVQRLARGERPELRDLLLTPSNVTRVTDQLAKMRGAAMKVGQLMSLDAGDIMPAELGEILSRLRADADYMPPRQLKSVLTRAWGDGWLRRFQRFDITPIAAASIGQVHRAMTKDGRDLAIKVQYPGVRASIDSDVANVGTLVKLSGLVPPGLDLAPLLEAARKQLHEEADYAREGACLASFGATLGAVPGVRVPKFYEDLSTQDVLAMEYIASEPIEYVRDLDQGTRDRVTARLLDLMAQELFDLRMMQTDPNFANYRYAPDHDALVLLDFGATREVAAELSLHYRELLIAGLAEDREGVAQAALALGFYAPQTASHHKHAVLDMVEMAFEPLRLDALFDFSDRTFADRMQRAGMAMAEDRSFDHVPPIEVLFLQRKFAGMALLGRHLRACVNLHRLLRPYLDNRSIEKTGT
ncbi:MAG: AarF/ABC1/UbiB kinase family protein [Pseudomonadota bacterium]